MSEPGIWIFFSFCVRTILKYRSWIIHMGNCGGDSLHYTQDAYIDAQLPEEVELISNAPQKSHELIQAKALQSL